MIFSKKISNLKLRLVVTLIIYGITISSLKAGDYIPVTSWQGPSPAIKQTLPDYLQTVKDLIFKPRFRWVTDDGDRGYYSLRPVFNRDSTLFLLNSGKRRQVKDGALLNDLYTLSGGQRFRNPIWSTVHGIMQER